MTNRGTTRTDLNAAAEAAALVLANDLGLGDETRVTDDWPVDDGDAVLVMELSGDEPGVQGSLSLAVNDEVAERLLANAAVLGAAFEGARAQVTAAVGAALSGSAVGRSSGHRPVVAVEILDGGQLTALAGLTLPLVEAAAPVAHDFEPTAFEPTPEHHVAAPASALSVLNDVDLVVTAELGRTTMPVRELLGLTPGMVVEIDRTAGSPIDLLVNGRRIAAGEVVVIDEEFGIRITEIAPTAERPR